MNSLTTFSALMVLFVALQTQSYGEEIKESEEDEEDGILSPKQIESCRNESNYRGDFRDEEPTQEFKCFLACAMVKLDVMDEKNGTLDEGRIEKIMFDEERKDRFKIFKTVVLGPCIQEVEVIPDHCELAYDYIQCAIKKTPKMKFD